MLFNSISFVVFLPIVFAIYWLIGSKNKTFQNYFLLLASIFFYGWWDFRFLALLTISIIIGYAAGIILDRSERYRRAIMFVGISLTLSFLMFFKYFDFFIESFAQAFNFFGGKIEPATLNLILPFGISFYTFKIVGYIIDVYYKRVKPTRNFGDFYLFVSFFPEIAAGPIDSAASLMPQIQNKRFFDYAKAIEGLRYILWGMFKKVVVADLCSIYVGDIFGNYGDFSASTLCVGAFYYAVQIYADFSGYSDIAIGIGKLFGFELMQNFKLPFLSSNVTNFWRNWHISLSKWFNDYFFTPIYTSLRNWGSFGMYVAIFLTFLLSGLWHGANWNYVVFGMLHGTAIIWDVATKKQRKKIEKKLDPRTYETGSVLLTLIFIFFTFILFRSPDVQSGFGYIGRIFSSSILEIPQKLVYLPMAFLLIIWEYIQRNRTHALDINHWKRPLRRTVYLTLTFLILYFYGQEQAFFYFQF